MQSENWVEKEIELIKERGLYRKFRTIESIPSPQVKIEGIEMIMASSNNYLGLSGDQRLIDAAIKAIKSYGVGSTGSRLTTGNTVWHGRLEERLAQFKQEEAALVFSSGYLANVGVISSIAGKGDVILSDQLNHASLIDGCRLSKAKSVIYRHVDCKDLEEKLKHSQAYQRRFIVTDSVFSMDGNIAPLQEIVTLAKNYQAFVIVDDAHATGVIGENGRGASEHCNTEIDITIGTLSKAIGTEGGFVTGSKTMIEFLRNQARSFIFQTALPPGSIAATLKAIDIIETNRNLQERLHRWIHRLRNQLTDYGFDVRGDGTPIVPVVIGEADKAVQFSELLETEGVFAPAIRPPTVPEGESRIRMTVMAAYEEKQIKQICQAFYKAGKELGVI
ncbi:8-amino-7-oxononanoate synthase [Thalassobacillus cyri]|uniref:8-amino-7-oxononanoate synthase n=1 Tax=Thalassobacillus cyri TaxID=571932 RepID=UPI000B807354|nr:8-amino-7-oxononanoate synthase [Thalassobacillus cyri]